MLNTTNNPIALLYKSGKTVFTTKDLAIIWQESNTDNLKSQISYHTKQKNIIRLSRGIFALDNNYNPKELATSIYFPCYISMETVLRESGVVFQHYDTIFVAGPRSKNIEIDKYRFTFRKIKPEVLYNSTGVINNKNYSMATTERAFLDMLYLFPNYYFDNLTLIRWEKCFNLVKVYQNKQLEKRLIRYYKKHA